MYMRNLLIIPGNSSSNQKLLDTYSDYFQDKDFKIHTVPWQHWRDDKKNFVDDSEVDRIVELINSTEGDFQVIAKSIGTIIFSKVLGMIDKKRIKKIFFLGLPIGKYVEKSLKSYSVLNDCENISITVIQAKNDPYYTFEQTENFIRNLLKNEKIKLEKIDRGDHDYPIEDVEELIS